MENKLYFVTRDFNQNCLEFHQMSEIRQFFNNMFKKKLFLYLIDLIELPIQVQRL